MCRELGVIAFEQLLDFCRNCNFVLVVTSLLIKNKNIDFKNLDFKRFSALSNRYTHAESVCEKAA